MSGPRSDEDFRAEVESHIALETDRLVAEGMAPRDARDAALRRFGNMMAARERFYQSRRFIPFDDCRRDMRHALRSFARSPVFTVTAVVSLAIGIGAMATIFTIANALLLRTPPGVAQPERVVDFARRNSDRTGISPASYVEYLDVRERATLLDAVFAYQLDLQSVSLSGLGGSGAERIFANLVTTNYFSALGVSAAAGRLFGAGDNEQPGASPIVVVSHGFWTRRFNADPGVIGQTWRLNGHPFTVVGVAGEHFRGMSVVAVDVWVPTSMVAEVDPQRRASGLTSRRSAWLMMGGRLATGVSVAQADGEISAIAHALEREHPDENRGVSLRVVSSSPVPPNLRLAAAGFFALLLALVSLVLAIACANLAGVQLARATTRRREIAVRLAIGAGRARLIRQLLIETVLLFLLGGAAGLLLTLGLIRLVFPMLPAFQVPVSLAPAIDGRVALFALALSLATALLSGLVPALQASKTDVLTALKNDAPWPADRTRARDAFVVAQIALSLLLVVCSGLLVRALERTSLVDPTLESHDVEVASLDLSMAGYGSTNGPPFVRELAARVRQLPGVQTATVADRVPTNRVMRLGGIGVPGVAPPDGQPYFSANWSIVEPGYFATLRLPLIAGRDFNASDVEGEERVVIIGEGAARRFWPGQDAVGRYLEWYRRVVERRAPADGAGPGDASQPPATRLTVIGVARDPVGLRDRSPLTVYIPLQQQFVNTVTILARTSGQRLNREIRDVVASMDPMLPLLSSQTLAEQQSGPIVVQLRIAAVVSATVGLVGLLLAAIGVYGVTAYAVARRTREIGVRIALGASRVDVICMILKQGLSLGALGVATGMLLAAGAGRFLSRLPYGVSPMDPAPFVGAATLFVAVGLVACFVPARRATSVDPVASLRCE